jgi:hypothetical protein
MERASVLSKESILSVAESLGTISDDVAEAMAPEIEYRLRDIIQARAARGERTAWRLARRAAPALRAVCTGGASRTRRPAALGLTASLSGPPAPAGVSPAVFARERERERGSAWRDALQRSARRVCVEREAMRHKRLCSHSPSHLACQSMRRDATRCAPQEARKFMLAARRETLTTADINFALRLRNIEVSCRGWGGRRMAAEWRGGCSAGTVGGGAALVGWQGALVGEWRLRRPCPPPVRPERGQWGQGPASDWQGAPSGSCLVWARAAQGRTPPRHAFPRRPCQATALGTHTLPPL